MEFNIKIDPDKVHTAAIPPWLITLLLEILKRFLEGQKPNDKDISDKP